MATRRSFLSSSLATAVFLVRATTCPSLRASEKYRFAIVAGKDNPFSDISIHDLRRAYKGGIVDLGGRRLVPLNLPPGSEHRVRFDHALLGMSPDAVGRYWIDRRIRGQSGAPRALDTPDLVMRVVARLPGALGYVRVNEVTANVQVLRVDGKAPTDSDYPIEY